MVSATKECDLNLQAGEQCNALERIKREIILCEDFQGYQMF